MKKLIVLLVALVSIFALSACGDVLVDLDTPRSEELSAQYDFYGDSMNTIRNDMGVTPEEADEVFIALVACGLDGKISTIAATDYGYKVRWGASSLEVALDGGVVVEVTDGRNILYPEQPATNPLLDRDIKTADVKSGAGEAIGEWAYISVLKSQLEGVTADQFKEFVEICVSGSGYNWFTIKCDDGTGIVFPGSAPEFAEYGTIDDDGTITEAIGTITLTSDGLYVYEQYEAD